MQENNPINMMVKSWCKLQIIYKSNIKVLKKMLLIGGDGSGNIEFTLKTILTKKKFPVVLPDFFSNVVKAKYSINLIIAKSF
jgi:hypothetical protein